jgi:hypothetical protein
MAEIHIDLKLKVSIPEKGIKINNLLYQLRKFMARLWDKYLSTDQFDGGSLPMDIAPSYNFGTKPKI